MSWPPDYKYIVSERLSEVMDDIGVNERLVMKRKRASMLNEKILTIQRAPTYQPTKIFCFGSQTEGSTTLGLEPDIDTLYILQDVIAIQSITEKKHGVLNLMMIQNEKVSPGYCNLQLIKSVLSLPECSFLLDKREHFVTDCRGKLLLKNTSLAFDKNAISLNKQWSPALSLPAQNGFCAEDIVYSLYCKSSPLQASSWLKKQTECTWPSENVMKSCRNAGCFVVPVGSKVSKSPELEWRVSTCLQERYLMFSLNITQLRCYVLMKMVLKTYIKPNFEDVLTSFMCKNVLFFCVADSSYEWHRGSLIYNLHTCLRKLKECVEQSNCPHFLIPENNLLAGRMTHTERNKLLDIINNLMANYKRLFLGIQIDDLGRRLMMKLYRILHYPNIKSVATISMRISSDLLCCTARLLTQNLNTVLNCINHESLEMAQHYLSITISIMSYHQTPLLSSTLGSVMAGLHIETITALSNEAFLYLEAGLESDALSGRLKLASVLYCTGDFERTENTLRVFQEPSAILAIHSKCSCYDKLLLLHVAFVNASNNYNEEGIKYLIAFCTRFLRCEINCVPHELRYEVWRSYSGGCWKKTMIEDTIKLDDKWMELIVVDSVPYLYFLQYKVYGQLERRREQQKALRNLAWSIDFVLGLGHKETALNLLGQCLEQENEQSEACVCYISSLKHRLRNNAGRLLMCIQLFKLRKKYNVL